jgi:catechol 2,3-dioxygenase-like lactoylglutathione lyase family enzyme
MHAIVFSPAAEKVRAFFADVLGMPSVDAGGGWLIFALPPAELAVHPADGDGRHQLYLMCDDIHATLAELRAKGAEVARDVSDQGWGLLAAIRTARSSPSTSLATRRRSSPDRARTPGPGPRQAGPPQGRGWGLTPVHGIVHRPGCHHQADKGEQEQNDESAAIGEEKLPTPWVAE